MLQRLLVAFAFMFVLVSACFGQNSNSSTTRPPQQQPTRSRPAPSPAKGDADAPSTGAAGAQSRTRRAGSGGAAAGATDPTSKGVLAAFNAIIDGIRAANVEMVTGGYWDSPQLLLFNYNGTTTRGWEQMRKNRESSYPNLKDVKLDVRDVRVQMLGREGALVTCLWTQTQTYNGAPETASGRMTLVFRRTNGVWKAVHLHTSPDAPDPSRVPASEQTDSPATKPKP